jgi:hypothetical protein
LWFAGSDLKLVSLVLEQLQQIFYIVFHQLKKWKNNKFTVPTDSKENRFANSLANRPWRLGTFGELFHLEKSPNFAASIPPRAHTQLRILAQLPPLLRTGRPRRCPSRRRVRHCCRRHLAGDPNLRHTDWFVLRLLRGDLVHVDNSFRRKSDTYLVDTSGTEGGTCSMRMVSLCCVRLVVILLQVVDLVQAVHPQAGRGDTSPGGLIPSSGREEWAPLVAR